MQNPKNRQESRYAFQRPTTIIVGVLLLLSFAFEACSSTSSNGSKPTSSSTPAASTSSKLPPADVTVQVNTSASAGVTNLQAGATMTENSKALSTDEGKQILQSSLGMINVQIMGWGADNPEPSPGQYNWGSLDARLQLMRDSGATPMITFCGAPDWMKGGNAGDTNWDNLDVAPLSQHYDDFAKLAQTIAERYPYVHYFQVWNEMKGFYSDSENRWDYEDYTTLYNKVYDAVKAVRPDAKIGGPYVVISSTNSYANANPAENTLDPKAMDVISYWLAHKNGADFIVVDGGPGTKDKVTSSGVKDEFAAGQFFADVDNWIHKQPGAGNLPIGWAEWYPGSSQNWNNTDHFNAIMANDLIATARSGAAYTLLWGVQGNRNGIALPEGIMTSQSKETPYTTTSKALKDFFPPGTQLATTTVSRPESIAVLASSSKVLLVNKTGQPLTVNVNSTHTKLNAYQVSVVDV